MSGRLLPVLLALGISSGCALINAFDGPPTPDGGASPDGGTATGPWSWQGAVMIDKGLPVESDAPRLAVTPAGDAWVTWQEFNTATSTGTVWVTTRPLSGPWGTPMAVPAVSGFPVATYPQVAVSGTFAAVVAYSADNGAAQPIRSIRALRIQSGMTPVVSDIARLDATTSNTPQMSQGSSVAMDASGNAVVAWGEQSGVFASESSGGTSWSAAAQIDQNTAFSWAAVAAAAGASGAALIGWTRDTSVVAQPVGIGAGSLLPGSQQTLASGQSLAGPLLAMRGNKALVVWPLGGAFGWQVYDNGEWGPSSTITATDADTEAALAMNNAGQAVLVWRRISAGSDFYAGTVWGAFYDGTVWSAPAAVSPQGSDRKAWWVAVDINDAGSAVAAWADFDSTGTYTRIWANELSFGHGTPVWQTAIPIDQATPTAGLADQPQNVRDIGVALNSAGSVGYVVYMQHSPGITPHTWVNWLQ